MKTDEDCVVNKVDETCQENIKHPIHISAENMLVFNNWNLQTNYKVNHYFCCGFHLPEHDGHWFGVTGMEEGSGQTGAGGNAHWPLVSKPSQESQSVLS